MLWTVWTMLNISPQHRWLGCSVFVWHDKDIISCCLVKPHLTILWWSWYMSKAYVVRIWVCENIQNIWLWWWLLSHFHEGFCPPERASEMSRMGAPLLLQSKKKKKQTQAYFKPFVKCVHVMLPDCTEVDEKHMLLLFLELCCGNSKSRRWLK